MSRLCFLPVFFIQVCCSAQFPVACYPFTGGSGSDVTGNGFDGVVSGALPAPDRTGAADNALDFNGTTDFVNIGPFGSIIPGDEFSVSFWLKADGSNSDAAIMTTPDEISDRLCIAPHYNHNGGNTVFWDYGDIFNNGRASIIPYAFSSEWKHWVFVHSAEQDRMAIYVDGQLTDEEPHHSTIVDRTKAVRIGGGPASGGTDFFFHGLIDDVQLYDVALSNGSVADLYVSQVNGWTCSLVGLDEAPARPAALFGFDGSAVRVDWSGVDRMGDLIISDMEGRIVRRRNSITGSRWSVPMEGSAPGLYIVRCLVNGQYTAGRVVVH